MVTKEAVRADHPGFHWSFGWSDAYQSTDAVDATSGLLMIRIDEIEVWGPDDGDWSWIDLLQWLIKSWTWLRTEEGLPSPLPADARSLRSLSDSVNETTHDSSLADGQRARMALWNFRETHDLSRALNGAKAPALLVWREGLIAHIITGAGRYEMQWPHVLDSLVGIGDAIVRRLAQFAPYDKRGVDLTSQWHSRDQISNRRLLEVARGQGSSKVTPLPQQWDRADLGEIETSPILAAARMTGRLPATLADEILQYIDDLPFSESTIASIASAVVEQVFLDPLEPPFEQAYSFARAFRQHLDLSMDAPFHAQAWLNSIGVLVEDVHLRQSSIEALAAWGPRNGPGILINRDGVASRTVGGRNASLAHEIGHLIMDRSSALPAAEVLGGQVSARVEQRARAFAAELLLPRHIAGDRFTNISHERESREAVNSLVHRYGVGREIVAWQARNSDATLAAEVYEHLRTLVASPDRY